MSSKKTGISWTDMTLNPTVGCSLMSPGCTNCYAMKLAHRWSGVDGPVGRLYGGLTEVANNGEPVWTGVVRVSEKALLEPLSMRRGKLIFVNSMSDIFHPALALSDVARIWAVTALATQHTFQVLTKRPDRMRDWLNDPATPGVVEAEMGKIRPGAGLQGWPLENVWIGTSVEDQKRANERIPILAEAKAAVRFLSVEPLLGPVSLAMAVDSKVLARLHWVIVGGESGPGARPMHPDWPRALRDECRRRRLRFFFKQVGTWGLPQPGIKRRTIGVMPDGRCVAVGTAGATTLAKLGAELAGELLDGRLHQRFPAAYRRPPAQGTLPFGRPAKKAA